MTFISIVFFISEKIQGLVSPEKKSEYQFGKDKNEEIITLIVNVAKMSSDFSFKIKKKYAKN